jgi:hypothetical protein
VKPTLAGIALLMASLALYVIFTRPLLAEAEALRAEYTRVRRSLAREGSEARIRTERLALWRRAVEEAGASGPESNPMLALRKRVLAATVRAGLRDVDLEVNPGRPPFGAAARISGDADFRSITRLLDAIDPATQGFVPEALSLSASDAADEISFALELQMPPFEGSTASKPASSLPVETRAGTWSRDPFRFQAVVPPPDLSVASLPRRTRPEPSATPEPAPPAPATPSIRLVGLVRRGGTLLAVVSTGSQIYVLGPGGEADGFKIVSVDEDGVGVRDPRGAVIELRSKD